MQQLIVQFSELINSPVLLTTFLVIISFIVAKISDWMMFCDILLGRIKIW